MSRKPQVSIIIPIFNEEAIVDTAVRALQSRLIQKPWHCEIILVQNGSTDTTAEIVAGLCAEFINLRMLSLPQADYGDALRHGIEAARGQFVICDEIDLGDVGFYERALELLSGGRAMVVGSKRHHESRDDRPWLRRTGTAVLNGMLRAGLGFHGTDTHGPKAFRRHAVAPIVERCSMGRDLFASELVIRAGRAGLDIVEIPLQLREIRPPSVGLMRRVPRALVDFGRLMYAVRVRDKLR